MAKKDLSKFKKQLEETKKEIETKLEEVKINPEMGDDLYDAETQETQEMANRLSIVQILRGHLMSINSALGKIAKRKYGVCEICKKDIPSGLLKLVPESKLCKECKRGR
ncbi:hypothetical protein HY227_00225 [Candidatus Wolfebacteria bacterium]|nr:hypothetical protein [Candidatus Wolfebacteria bacterium]